MADKSLVTKLGIKPAQTVLVMNAPDDYLRMLGDLPERVTLATDPPAKPVDGLYDCVQAFVRNAAELDRDAPTALQALKAGGLLWFMYPKLTSKLASDLSRDVLWDVLLKLAIRPVTQIAVDNTWSGLRFRPISEVKSTRTNDDDQG